MAAVNPYQYVTLRCVPRVDREEFVNVGVVLYCQATGFLDCRCDVAVERLRALAPGVDVEAVYAGLRFVEGVCRGEEDLGEVAGRDLSTRFGFLKAPRSTVVQPGPVHGGLTEDPAAELGRLLEALVR
ncbi:DUF3037 domain-containing protein [Nocardioides mangrovicus]|uniref:DUF3037 domain-containing protein n=1 Tax=Nocardioides mangrovicus TaxID=2478913 RepID=A0A3L8P222_9ACTN|nr:DUF3037 domain-containing protein [Nocardioides mangrovicus]RLV49204.1 DUF3037 domain-containing protein [Nocardioides mangrovicus]